MKHLKPFQLFEGKNIADLYHIIDVRRLLFIIETNTIQSQYYINISTTREKSLNNYPGAGPLTFFKLELDGEKISQNFKVKPFRYKTRQDYLNEYEEQIKTSIINNAFYYIKRIILMKSNFENFIRDHENPPNLITTEGIRKLGNIRDIMNKIVSGLEQYDEKLYVQDNHRIYYDENYINHLLNFPLVEIDTKKIIAYRGYLNAKEFKNNIYGKKDIIVDFNGNIMQNPFIVGEEINLENKNYIELENDKNPPVIDNKYFNYSDLPFEPYVLNLEKKEGKSDFKITFAEPLYIYKSKF